VAAQASAPVILDAAFDAIRTVVRMVRTALVTRTAAVDVYALAFHAGVAMEVLAELVASPVFYHAWVAWEWAFFLFIFFFLGGGVPGLLVGYLVLPH
jgi:hypothetical protein